MKLWGLLPLKDKQDNFVVVGNELYNNQTGKFKPFDPSIIVTRKVKVGYNPHVKEPTINGWKPTEWLKGLFNNDKESYDLASLSVVSGLIVAIKSCKNSLSSA